MALFYYPNGGELRQIEADSYRRIQSAPTGADYGWQQTLIWDSGLTESYFSGDLNPNTSFQKTGSRCGNNGQGIGYTKDGQAFCAENGTPPRRRLESLNFTYVPADGICNTEFLKNESVILTLPTCPDIEGDIRNPDCSDCCRELLPIARRISV